MNFVCKHAQEEKMNSYPLIYYPDLSKHIYIYYGFYLVIQNKGGMRNKKSYCQIRLVMKKRTHQKLWVTNLMRKMVPKFPPFSRQGDNNNRADGILSQKGPRPTKCSTEKW